MKKKMKQAISATVCRTLWRSEDHQTSEFTQTLKTCTWCTHHLCTPTHIYAPLHHRSCCLPQGMRSPHPPQQSSGRRELWCTWVCNTGLNWPAHVSCKETPKHALANQWMAHCRDTYCRPTCEPLQGVSTDSLVTHRTGRWCCFTGLRECRDLTCMMSQMEWKHWPRGACACRRFQGTPGRCPGGRGSAPPLHNGPPAEAHWGPLMWGGDEWGESLWKTRGKINIWTTCPNFLSISGHQNVAHLFLMSCSTWCAPFPWYSHVCRLFLTSWLLFTPRCIRKRWNASLLRSLNSSRLNNPVESGRTCILFWYNLVEMI